MHWHVRRRCTLLLMLLLVITASGCTTSKKLWKVMKDPDVPVGDVREPSTVALSLVAARDVNPNPFQPIEAAPVTDVPYNVNLSGESLDDLARQLQITLQQVEGEVEQVHASAAAAPVTATPVQVTVEEALAEPRVASAQTTQPQNAETPPESVSSGDGVARQLGQYRHGDTEEPALESSPSAPTEINASPIAFQIIQLKDDGRFLSADFDSLSADMEKALGKTYLEHDDYVLRPGQYKFVRFAAVKKDARYLAVVARYNTLDNVGWKAITRIEPTGHQYPLLIALGAHGVTITQED